ncbi:hypothetical protein M409DRAFT_57116 [Zasmidium cellare ATCC 36951]|uniref:Rhodopsin domain-containing protein n=1 Tax=Zasmidium cellare ATCC 36951 TaxID=1080233 RepID=A0A6A6CEE6_ZASCE|nr:uncharacterized protein M409DRAFT_57116 [Zasmidium cellare ATCC 36951]KAF2164019.1 hypothetical protein M409DRAFT_57116 [Zasmidium cellare ATCC 36951]
MSAPPPPPTLPDLDSGPRSFITTDQDHGGIALTISTLMATWVVLCFFVRIYMRATVSGPFGMDDIVCSIATIFGVIQMIVSSAAVSFGFGKALELLTEAQIDQASKAVYAAQLLYIVTNTLTKCTVALLLARIVFIKSRVYACYGVLAASVVWGVGSFLAEAIRCTGSPPWKTVGSQCSNLFLAWQVITAFNVILEAVLLAVPVWLVWGLQTDLMRKFTVVAVFWLRSPVIVAALIRIHFLGNTIGSPEPLLRGVVPFILLNVEMHYGLMAATMPTLKPFVGAFNTGWGTYDTTGQSGYGQNSSGSYAMQSLDRRSNKSKKAGSKQNSALRSTDRDPPSFSKNITHIRSIPVRDADSPRAQSAESSESQQMIIRQTLTTEVHYEEEEARRRELNSSRGNDSIDYNLHVKQQ